MYVPQDRYVWDFWLVKHNGWYHLFHLQAPRDLPDPEMRHGMATVGHAISKDLINWENLGTALSPGKPGSWDDRAIWTGSIVEKDGLFYMFYTGTCLQEKGQIQRIGVAISSDLIRWKKLPQNPILEADLTIYEDFTESPFCELAWRDPYVIKYDNNYMAFITARKKFGEVKARGCIATAISSDLLSWKIGAPLFIPDGFAQMEVPQVVTIKGRYYLLFSAKAEWIKTPDLPKVSGTFYASASHPLGPYTSPRVLLADERGTYYAAKIIYTFEGSWAVLAWININEEGEFVGGISNPFPLQTHSDGTLEVKADEKSFGSW